MSEKTYRRLALEDPEGAWELHDGRLRQKPTMSVEHNHIQSRFFLMLGTQLSEREFAIRTAGRVRRSVRHYYIPEVYIVPMELVRPGRRRPNRLDA